MIAQGDAIESSPTTRRVYVQKDAPEELRVISQPPVPGSTLADYPDYYYFLDTEEETFIYDIGNGINLAHSEFADPRRKIEWLYTRFTEFRGQNTPTEIPGFRGHHTCTASKATGILVGSAKKSTLIVVKIPDLSEASFVEVWEVIVRDIVAKNRRYHSVVNFSYSDRGKLDAAKLAFWRKTYQDITDLIRMGVPITVSAGNEGPGYISSFPANGADHWGYIDDPIVVGAVDNVGNQASFSEQLRIGRMIWAPGVDIRCAAGSPSTSGFRTVNGTSVGKRPMTSIQKLNVNV